MIYRLGSWILRGVQWISVINFPRRPPEIISRGREQGRFHTQAWVGIHRAERIRSLAGTYSEPTNDCRGSRGKRVGKVQDLAQNCSCESTHCLQRPSAVHTRNSSARALPGLICIRLFSIDYRPAPACRYDSSKAGLPSLRCVRRAGERPTSIL